MAGKAATHHVIECSLLWLRNSILRPKPPLCRIAIDASGRMSMTVEQRMATVAPGDPSKLVTA
ncbi:hypothetical protein C1879_02730 [Paraeggerthella hongkongensis]|nr:hypothetical protein C1879_02730 [Paraeggerthella hongkongensis]